MMLIDVRDEYINYYSIYAWRDFVGDSLCDDFFCKTPSVDYNKTRSNEMADLE